MERNRSTLYATLDWLKDQGAIGDEDLQVFERLKKKRNKVAHELFNIVQEGYEEELAAQFNQLIELIRKIDVWWVVHIEIPTDPDLYDKEIEDNKIEPGSLMLLKMMLDIALAPDEVSGSYLKHFKQLIKQAV